MYAKAKYRKDYQSPDFTVTDIHLDFQLEPEKTIVVAKSQYRRLNQNSTTLRLDGRDFQFSAIKLNGKPFTQYQQDHESLTLDLAQIDANQFELEVTTILNPAANTSLQGVYQSGEAFCTQCEAEGFRQITYMLDRPDVLARYTTKITADKAKYPLLLSNGNRINNGDLEDGRHWVEWNDPFPKPSYLFALVAGDFDVLKDKFITKSGREVALELYVNRGNLNRADWAMQSLKNAMKWDEERFDLEYDLDIYMVVAVGDFNMGAMENKGLNIFNTSCVLADSRTATDADFARVEAVIAHEYFHNWTGNRVTCRDWFQLSLKEGLTVFRDQEFSGDRASRAVRRIENIRLLRQHQFPEDAGPTAHPVRPASYEEMNNFYTMTVYEKGAEVVRMYHTLLGEEGFQKGMKLYFQRHDGQAVTCDDFRAAMADANGINLDQFALWYSQAGTPVLEAEGRLKNNIFELTIKQTVPPTPDMADKQPMMIPVKVGLLNRNGEAVAFDYQGKRATEAVLLLTEAEQTFLLEGVTEAVVPSLLRGFSAPVHLNYPYSDDDLLLLLAHDSDAFTRWEAAQTLYRRAVAANLAALSDGVELPKHEKLLAAVEKVISDDLLDNAFKALLLGVPSEAELWDGAENIDPLRYHQAREALLDTLAVHFLPKWHELNRQAAKQENQSYEYSPEAAGWRTLRNVCRAFVLRADPAHIETVAEKYGEMAQNMTHEWGILSAVNGNESDTRNRLLAQFADKFSDDALVMDKYFALVGSSRRSDTLQQVQTALQHPKFSLENPNKARSLIGSFSRNVPHFHAEDGSGYRFIAGKVIEIDRFNPQVAARLVQAFNLCNKREPHRKNLVKQELQRIRAQEGLSKDVGEIVGKILD